MFRFSENELRQDPQSHHLILNRYFGAGSDVHDPSFGAWTCAGGERAGETCEPTDLASAATGHLHAARSEQSFACIGFGPRAGGGRPLLRSAARSRRSRTTSSIDGVFAPDPDEGHPVLELARVQPDRQGHDDARVAELLFRRRPAVSRCAAIFDASRIFSANAAPFTKQTICNDHVLPQGARLFAMSSHTHKHGQHFTVTMPDGIADLRELRLQRPGRHQLRSAAWRSTPPTRPSARCATARCTTTACTPTARRTSTWSRALARADSARAVRSALCTPDACVSGKIGAPCNGVDDDRACDSAPGANDGFCDACNITGGESTENEMFILIGSYYIPE